MPTNGKTADEIRAEYYEELRRERAEREASSRRFDERLLRERAEREAESRRLRAEQEEKSRLFRAEQDEASRRFRAEQEEASRQFRENMRKSHEEWEARMDRERAEWNAQKEKRDREWDRITGEWGRFNNDEGGMVEYEGIAALRRLTEIGGMPIEVVSTVGIFATKKGREYDCFIVCPDAVILVEFKRRLTREHVRKFLDEQLPQFPLDLAILINSKRVYGAVAGVMVDDDAKALAAENGLFAIRLPANRDVEMLNNTARPRGNGRAAGN